MKDHPFPLAVAVIIPAHNEQDLLTESLRAVSVAVRQARRRRIRTATWVVLDACTDGSSDAIADAEISCVTIDARNVGIARRTGADAALNALRDLPLERIWLAHTDADSVVPANWITHQLRLAGRGVDAVVGTVKPDFRDLSAQQREAWEKTHPAGIANGHVHGANLGILASIYRDAGGFLPATVSEDVLLIEAARARGARIEATDGARVLTSGRQVGRAPDGYARYLREDLVELARSSGVEASVS